MCPSRAFCLPQPLAPSATIERGGRALVAAEGASPGKPTRRRGRDEPPQFTLGGLLAFFTGITVCISLAATGARVVKIDVHLGILLFSLTWALTWILLYVTYRRLRWIGPALSAGLGLFSLGMQPGPAEVGPLVFTLLAAVCWGCAVGSGLSVPVFVVTMAVRLARGATGGPRSQSQLPVGSYQPPQLVEEPGDHLRRVRCEDGEP